MHIELNRAEAEVLRELLEQKILELDKEINRTDSLAFKGELHQLDRAMERVLAAVKAALSGVDANERQRVSHASGPGPGAPASERVGEFEGRRPSTKEDHGGSG